MSEPITDKQIEKAANNLSTILIVAIFFIGFWLSTPDNNTKVKSTKCEIKS